MLVDVGSFYFCYKVDILVIGKTVVKVESVVNLCCKDVYRKYMYFGEIVI